MRHTILKNFCFSIQQKAVNNRVTLYLRVILIEILCYLKILIKKVLKNLHYIFDEMDRNIIEESDFQKLKKILS